MDMLYWAGEYIKVFLAYFAVMFVWPSVVFHGYLKKKSLTVRFAFCTTVQIILINTVVLGLGLLHLLHGWIVALLFYGVFLLAIFKRHRLSSEEKDGLRRLKDGTYGIRLFLSDRRKELAAWSRKKWKEIWEKLKGHKLEYLSLAVVVVFGMMYFSYGAFQDHSYGFGDMYTHHSWIDGLMSGKPFSDGIYPEAMHCFIYLIRVVFGIDVYNILLFLAGIHVMLLLVSVYLLFKELFAWKGTALWVVISFLTVDVLCIDEVYSMSRLQWSLPQEFGLFTVFLCPLFLYRCLKENYSDMPKKIRAKIPYLLKQDEVVLFMLALACSLTIHFYVTIMAFFVCLIVAICRFRFIFQKKRFGLLICSVIMGLIIAIAPMGLALAEGIPFQGSIGWAVNVINGTDHSDEESYLGRQQGEETQILNEDLSNTQEIINETEMRNEKSPDFEITQIPKKSIKEKVETRVKSIIPFIRNKAQILYDEGYLSLYKEKRAPVIVLFTVMGAGLWVCYRFFAGIIALIRKKKKKSVLFLTIFDAYPIITGMSIIFMMLYAASALGIPELVARSRICAVGQILILAMMFIPVDMFFAFWSRAVFHNQISVVMLAGIIFIYTGTQKVGIFHGYLYNELTRYNSAVDVTNKIIQTFPSNSYTIVSTTDELYQIIEYGRHEELLTFAQKISSINYTLPTKYIFVFVEKKPIEYAQSHFQEGPDWLALNKYTAYYNDRYSAGRQINASHISTVEAEKQITLFSRISDSYFDLENRTIIESKVDQWFQKFSKIYPEDTEVYYEDADFCCYAIRQDTNRLYQLEVK